MSIENVEKLRLMILDDESMAERFALSLENGGSFSDSMVALGTEQGLAFSTDDVDAALKASPLARNGELSEGDLDNVVGGTGGIGYSDIAGRAGGKVGTAIGKGLGTYTNTLTNIFSGW